MLGRPFDGNFLVINLEMFHVLSWFLTEATLSVFFQVLSLRPWRSGSSWSSYLSGAAVWWTPSRCQVLMGAAGPTAQQTAVERSTQRTWPWCWLGRPGPTTPWPSWRSVECSWSFHRTPNWSVSCWESLRRGRGGYYQTFINTQGKEFQHCFQICF